jgi:hypothetical protein
MIEHFFEWLELVPLPYCSNERVAHAFIDKVLSKFGALTKLFTDQSTKFGRDIQDLCEKALIEHLITS